MQAGASPARYLFNHFELCLVSSPLCAICRAESPILSLPIRLTAREEEGLSQGHITSQTTTPVPTLTDPGTVTHRAAFLFSKEQDRKEAALGYRGMGFLQGPHPFGKVGLEPTSYGAPVRSSCHLLTKTCLIWAPSIFLNPSPPLPPIHSAPAAVTSFQLQGLCTGCDHLWNPSAPNFPVTDSILLLSNVTSAENISSTT